MLIRFLGTYFPRKEVSIEEQIKAVILKPNEAVRLRAKKEMIDRDGTARETGEEWLNRTIGSYLPLAYEEVVSTVKAYVLTDKVFFIRQDSSTILYLHISESSSCPCFTYIYRFI